MKYLLFVLLFFAVVGADAQTYSGDTSYMTYLATHPKYIIINGDTVKTIYIANGATFLCSTNGITYNWQGKWIPQLTGIAYAKSPLKVINLDTVAFDTAGQVNGYVLTSRGTGSTPTWQAGGGGDTAHQAGTGIKINYGTIDTFGLVVPVAVTNGGTGQSSALTNKGIVYAASTTAMATTAAGTTGQFLAAVTGGAPVWQTPSGGNPYLPQIYYGGTNSFFTTPGITDTAGTFTLAANTAYFIPITFGATVVSSQFYINVTGSVAGDSLNCAIYSDTLDVPNADHRPKTLIKDSGASTAGQGTGDVFLNTSNFTLTANTLYWLYINSNQAITICGWAKQKSGYSSFGFAPLGHGTILGESVSQTYNKNAPSTAPLTNPNIRDKMPLIWITLN